MLTKNIKLKLFRKKKLNRSLKKKLIDLINEENFVIKSLKKVMGPCQSNQNWPKPVIKTGIEPETNNFAQIRLFLEEDK